MIARGTRGLCFVRSLEKLARLSSLSKMVSSEMQVSTDTVPLEYARKVAWVVVWEH